MMSQDVQQVDTMQAPQDSKQARSLHVDFANEYPESVVEILLHQPLNPLVKLEFSKARKVVLV